MPIAPEVGGLGVEVLNAARRWRRSRVILRRTLDSKTASKQQKDKARRSYENSNAELEVVVGKLEGAMRASGPTVPMDKKRAAIPWKKIAGAISEVARAVETTVDNPTQANQVIDATPPDRK